jgi:hypothetical protein
MCQLLLQIWGSTSAASRLEKCGTAVVIVERKAHQLDSSKTLIMFIMLTLFTTLSNSYNNQLLIVQEYYHFSVSCIFGEY